MIVNKVGLRQCEELSGNNVESWVEKMCLELGGDYVKSWVETL